MNQIPDKLISRRRFLKTVGATTLAAGAGPAIVISTQAQPTEHMPRIGLLASGGPHYTRANLEAFQQGLRALGYIEGQNIAVEYRYAEGQSERASELAAELVNLPVQVIVAAGSTAISATQHATGTIPIVMAGTADPVWAGFVASLAHPGGNITGVSDLNLTIPAKSLELLRETVPQSSSIAVLADPAATYYRPWKHKLTVAAHALGVSLHIMDVHREDEFASTFAAMSREGVDALLVLEQGLLRTAGLRKQTVALAATNRLPAIYQRKRTVEMGGLMSYGPSIPERWRDAVTYMDKILKGAMPADLPVAQATKFELVINLKTAQALGLTVPPTILLQAAKVI